MTMQITSPAFSQAITAHGTGALSPATRLGQLNFTMQLPKGAGAAFGSAGFSAAEAMTKLSSIPMNVWIDQQHLVRQLSMGSGEQHRLRSVTYAGAALSSRSHHSIVCRRVSR